ncbi:RNA-directed DNA polymerase, eukaryota, reverse transcriptase zinc-binding domain protein [Tanacetum coccineum]
MEIGEKKITWIKWKKSMARKEDGGLGIGSLYGFNRALLYKWKWRFRTAPDALWVKIIKSLFGHDGGLLVYKYTGNSNSIWVNILKASKELESKNVGLDALVKKQIGDGMDTKFWEDLWIGECTLKEKFPRNFRLDTKMNALVKDQINLSLDLVWLRRRPRGGLNQISGINFYPCSVLVPYPYKKIGGTPTRWSKDVPIKINVFIWKLLFDKPPTRDNLEKKGLDVPSTLCGICDDVSERLLATFS